MDYSGQKQLLYEEKKVGRENNNTNIRSGAHRL